MTTTQNAFLDDGDSTGGFAQTPGKSKEPRWDEKIKWYALPDDGQAYTYRLVGKPTFFFNHWITTKKKDGAWGKPFAVLCKNYDSTSGKFVDGGCRACEYYRNINKVYGDQKVEFAKWPDAIKKMAARSTMAINAIIRDIQTQGAPPGLQGWTYLAPVKFPKGFAETITEKAQKFNRKPGAAKDDKNGYYAFNHAEFGKDLMISYNSQADASKMYDLEIGQRTPLTPEEIDQAQYRTVFTEHIKYMDDEKVEELLQRGGYYDLLQSIQAQGALSSAQARIGLDTKPAPAQEIPRSAPVVQQQAATPAVAAAPAATQVIASAQAIANSAFATDEGGGMTATEDGVPDALSQAQKSTQATAPATPPVQAPAQAAAPAGAATPAMTFASQHGRALKAVTQDVSSFSLRSVTTGSLVPVCFSEYSKNKTTAPDVCKVCPIKLDCMQVEE
jgi:hypothetical protein